MSTNSMVILVTGASSGIGKATASYLSSQGHIVYGTGRFFQNFDSINGFTCLQLDVTDTKSIEQGISLIIKKEGKLDVLVNNAGLGIAGPVEESNIEDVKKILDTNVIGVINMIQATAPIMRKQRSGYIINITSIGSKFSLPYRGVYCASKFAVEGITEALSMELRPFQVKVCTVAPGDVATSINENRLHSNVVDSDYPSYPSTLLQITEEVKGGIKPIKIGEKIHKIIQLKKPLLHYRVATPMQRFSVIIKRILPGRWFEKLIMNHYNV
ncbi:MAG: NADP-dependent 3-hydroxy acid dehydrogenase YdfG [Flavobacteriales bacterium]|jgi:NADP-dependent 3-hydroxy acid dehydrogenase YdfG